MGEQGETGERGDSGQRGISGERGPKGDHGQAGDVGLTGKVGRTGLQGEPGEPGESTILSRHVSAWYLLLALVVTVVLATIIYNIVQNRGLAQDGREAKDALCTFRADLVNRVERGEAYILEVEEGTRKIIPGVTVKDLQRSVESQRATLRALHLDCP